MNAFSKFVSSLKEKDDVQRSAPFLCRTILIIIIAGVLIRLVLGFFMTFVYDMYHWGAVIQNINSGNGLYGLTGYFYTPVWGYVLGIESFFQDLFGITNIGERLTGALVMDSVPGYFTGTITTIAFNMSVKLMFMISDLAVGYLIFWLIRDITKDKRKAVVGFALWFLCPFVMTVGSVIAQFDTIFVMMTLLSVILLRKDRYLESGVMLCMATLMKFFSGFFIFIFIAYILSKNKEREASKKVIVFIAGAAVTAFVLFLPQLLDGTIADAFLFVTSRVNEGVGDSTAGAVGGYVALCVYVLAFIVSVVLAMRIKNNNDGERSDRLLFDSLLVTTAVMFLYPPLPQYVLLLFAFLIFAMLSDIRYRIPCALLIVGTTIVTVSGGPMDLAAVAAYTNIMDLSGLMDAVIACTSPFLGYSPMDLVAFIGYAIQYIGILTVLWLRFGERIKGIVQRHAVRKSRHDDDGDTAVRQIIKP